MDLLIIEIGIEIEKSPKEVEEKAGSDIWSMLQHIQGIGEIGGYFFMFGTWFV